MNAKHWFWVAVICCSAWVAWFSGHVGLWILDARYKQLSVLVQISLLSRSNLGDMFVV